MLAPSLQRYWSLFEDWCDAFDEQKEPTTPDTLVRFLHAFPAGAPTNTLRVRAIRLHHQDAGVPLDLDGLRDAITGFDVRVPEALTLIRRGEPYITSAVAIAQLPKVHRGRTVTTVVRGRRDAFLIVLFADLSLNRDRLRAVTAADITLRPLRINDALIPRGNAPASCSACAVTRWLRIVWATERADHATIRRITSPITYSEDTHDCDDELEPEWRHATTLLPAVDKHGWVDAHRSISTRTLSALADRLQRATGYREQSWTPVDTAPTRFDAMDKDEFDSAMEDFDRRIAEALTRSAEALANAQQTAALIDEHTNPTGF